MASDSSAKSTRVSLLAFLLDIKVFSFKDIFKATFERYGIHGIPGYYLDTDLKKEDIDLTIINEESDGTFPNHHPDPSIEDNLEELKKKVLEVHADLGIGFDGDGDRVGIVDEKVLPSVEEGPLPGISDREAVVPGVIRDNLDGLVAEVPQARYGVGGRR